MEGNPAGKKKITKSATMLPSMVPPSRGTASSLEHFGAVPFDFKLLCSDRDGNTREVKVHKAVLQLYSPWFRQLFQCTPSSDWVKLEEPFEAVEKLVSHFVYSLPAKIPFDLEAHHAIRLCAIADKYELKHAVDTLISYLCSNSCLISADPKSPVFVVTLAGLAEREPCLAKSEFVKRCATYAADTPEAVHLSSYEQLTSVTFMTAFLTRLQQTGRYNPGRYYPSTSHYTWSAPYEPPDDEE